MLQKDVIEIKFVGSDISPAKVRASELAKIIESVEEMIASVIVRDHPKITKESIVVGLINIEQGSVKLDFIPDLYEQGMSAFQEIGQAINSKNFSKLPKDSIRSLNLISSFTKKYNCAGELRSRTSDNVPLAVITSEIKIEPDSILKGQTTLYGNVIRVGGKTPKIMLETIEGLTIFCDIDQNLAIHLGNKLYKAVGLKGTASWNSRDFSIESFRIESITDYEEISLSKSINELSKLAGKYFSDIDDVEQYVFNLRNVTDE